MKILVFLLFFFVAAPISNADAKLYFTDKNELSSTRRLIVAKPSAAEPLVDNSSFILAADSTNRKDPLNGYGRYTGGWNISNEHYWASVGYASFTPFIIAVIWFVGFGFLLFIMSCVYCCCRRRNYSYSRMAYTLSLILLVVFTLAAVAGCCVLYIGQGKFHHSTSDTMDYIESQANFTVDNLRNYSTSLAAAKSIDVDHIFIPADVLSKIDPLQKKLNSSANDLSTRSSNNLENIDNVLDTVQLFLIIVAGVMLLLAFLGFLFSLLGLQVLVYILVILGWVLVAGTFILCGVSLLFHNVVADTCIAMDDWVHHPHAHTALDDILPCVDTATANESFYQSREVTFQLVRVVNQVIVNISNVNYPSFIPPPLNFNQSGPMVPTLCSPYSPDLSDRVCQTGEVDFKNATEVWKGYVCNTKIVNNNEICTTVGRLTLSLYNQIKSSVNVSHGIYRYSPFVTQLLDCTFVRETFTEISIKDCSELRRFSRWIYIGLLLVSATVMLSLLFWVIYARERRHRAYNKQFIARSGGSPLVGQDKV